MATCAVVIPVFGRQELTHALLGDIAREDEDLSVIVVDNGRDYQPLGSELVLPQTENLGWLKGSNVGMRTALTSACDSVVLLNNDTRLSLGFFTGLLQASRRSKVGIVGPRYDDHWPHQHLDHPGPPDTYPPVAKQRRADFVDGTCMLIGREVLDAVGLLDEETFGRTGWGADIDLAIRARQAGWRVVVTDQSYLTHASGSTASATHGSGDHYWLQGNADLRAGLAAKWGPDWLWISGLSGRGPRVRVVRVFNAVRGR